MLQEVRLLLNAPESKPLHLCSHFSYFLAHTQEQMNLYFQGTAYKIGERYTSMTTIVFVCFFYAALFPAAFFFGAAILTVQYYGKRCMGIGIGTHV